LSKHENGATIPDVLKATIKNRLKEKKIDDADKYVSKDFTEEDKKKKHAIRGIKSVKPSNLNAIISEESDLVQEIV
jgi:hypothetical protein